MSDYNSEKNRAVWLDIPVADLERACEFYAALHGDLFGPLRDLALFRQAAVDAEVGVITWPNGADIDPSILYQWDAAGDEFCRALQRLPKAESTSA
ncbi:MAG: DUF2442 domain-containing protein [Verrucomicrobia subdivision 3 bacterium]|nr:DUF2442 domain-containing protein [Limisphaerales bacterium]